MTSEICPGCGLALAPIEGPTDPYDGSSPSCWALFNQVTLKDYGEYRYPAAHRLIVDAYMAQHPNFATASGRRSVAVHLVGLYLVLDQKLEASTVGPLLGRVFPLKEDLEPLVPIPPLGELTVAHVYAATNPGEHETRAKEWAHAVHRAWAPHRARIVTLANAALETDRRRTHS